MKGFTLIEIVVVVALISGLSLMTIPASINQYKIRIAEESALDILHFLRLSQNNAKVRLRGTSNGIKILDNSFTVFSGESYNLRNSSVDESYAIPLGVSIDGVDEVVFEEISGKPFVEGDINVSVGVYVNRIHISSAGVIEIL